MIRASQTMFVHSRNWRNVFREIIRKHSINSFIHKSFKVPINPKNFLMILIEHKKLY